VYRRKLDGRVLEFGHAGILYKNSFVMYDKGTNSLWVHVTGRAEAGPLKGKQLEFMPSTVTTWANWKRNYPGTRVLPGHRRGGFMGTYSGIFPNELIGLALVVKFKGKLYPFGVLAEQNVVNDRFNGTSVLVYYAPEEGTAVAWGREVDGGTLTFVKSEKEDAKGDLLLQDNETGSSWSWLRGVAVDGQLKGRELEPLLHNPILNERFGAFYPGAPVYGSRE